MAAQRPPITEDLAYGPARWPSLALRPGSCMMFKRYKDNKAATDNTSSAPLRVWIRFTIRPGHLTLETRQVLPVSESRKWPRDSRETSASAATAGGTQPGDAH